jgi:hypothetical protein
MSSDRSPLHPDPFSIAPFFCLLPEKVSTLSIENTRPVLFSRLDQILTLRSGSQPLEREHEMNLILEEAMLRELLQFTTTIPETKKG